MKNCFNLVGAIALLVFVGSCCSFFSIAGGSDWETEAELNQASESASPYMCAGILSFIVFSLVAARSRRVTQQEKQDAVERRHQEQIDAMYLAASMQAQASRPAIAVNEDDLMIERAKQLYQQGDIEGCKALLRTMPNNPKVQKVLAKIERR